MKEKLFVYVFIALVIASLIGSTIYYYNRSIALAKEIKIVGNMLEAEKERDIGVNVGTKIADQEMKTLDEKKISLVPLKGNESIIILFKTGCEPCIEQIESMQKLMNNKQLSPRVSVVAVTKEQTESVKKFATKHHITMPIVASANKIISDFNVSLYPFTYVINEKGFIELRQAGFEKGSASNDALMNLLKSGKLE